MRTETEQALLTQALEALQRETGVQPDTVEKEPHINGGQLTPDFLVEIKGQKYAIEVKKWAQQTHFGAMVERMKRLPEPRLLVADYVNPNMAERLRNADIQFLDTAGNAYINAPPLYIHIKGNRKPDVTTQHEQTIRAFTQTGLKVVFAFLCNPNLVKAAYRDIAGQAQVALGTVGWVIGDLKAMGYLIDRGKRQTRRLNNYYDLLDRRVELYPALLRPKQFLGVFNKHNLTDEEQMNLNIKEYDAYWSGEAAGNEHTGYIRAEVDMVYIPEHRAGDLIRRLKLFKGGDKAHGIIKLYKPFWQKPEAYNGYVHPVLAYADLIATGDARNIETAKLIKDEYIKPLGQA
jgi:hypothetical protein